MKMMMTVLAAIAVLAGMAMAEEGSRQADAPQPAAKSAVQSVCPADGGAIKRDLFTDHDGKRIFVCSTNCLDVVKKNAESVVKKMEADGIVPGKVQTKCPVMGGAIDKKAYFDFEGKRIYICCGGCMGALKADPGKYVRKLEAEGVVLDPAEPAESASGTGAQK